MPNTGDSQYFNAFRMNQEHIGGLIAIFIVILVIVLLEKSIAAMSTKMTHCFMNLFLRLKAKIKKTEFVRYHDENDDIIDAPDYYYEISFS